MTKHMMVFMTASNEDEAAMIAKTLVSERLCACVNILPGVRSIYRWEGTLHDEQEVMVMAKTASTLAPIVVNRVKALHSYDVPEIICLPVATGAGDYLDWIDESVEVPTRSEEAGEL